MTTSAGTWAVRPTLDSSASRQMVDAAVAEASALSVSVTVVAVDESGVLKELCRMDGAPLVSVQTALNKAYPAAAIGMPPDLDVHGAHIVTAGPPNSPAIKPPAKSAGRRPANG